MDIRDIYKPVRGDIIDIPLQYLREEAKKYDLDPHYQRDHVWTKEQQQAYVGFVIEGGQGSPISINAIDYEHSGVYEVVDGKQRLTALLDWLNGNIFARLTSGEVVWRKDVGRISMICIKVLRLRLTRPGVLEYYIKINSGGTVHDEEEIQKVQDILDVYKTAGLA